MKNKAIDLHNILFEQLERLNGLTGEEMKDGATLQNESKRAEMVLKIAGGIISNGRLVLEGMRFAAEVPEAELPEMLAAKVAKTLPAPEKRRLLDRPKY